MTEGLSAIRAYVTMPESQRMADTTVALDVTHSLLKARNPEFRFDLHSTVADVKGRVYRTFGTPPSQQQLVLTRTATGDKITLGDESKKLGYYSPVNGDNLHIVDLDPTSLARGGGLEDVSQVEKYVMSDEDYAKRDGTYRKYKEEMLKKDPNWTLFPKKEPTSNDETGKAEAEAIKVNERCEVNPGGRRGTVRFVGPIEGMPAGFWVGVQLDEPVGKNDGSVKGVRLFECPEKYGVCVRPDKVTVGDFPEEDFEM